MSPVKNHMTRALRPTARKSAPSDRIPTPTFGALVFALLTFLIIALPTISSAQMSGFGGDTFGGDDELVSVTPYFSISSAAPGGSYPADIRLTMLPGWHVNSARPYQDWLIAAEVTFDTLGGITPHSIEYPDGHDTQLAGETISVYSGTTNIPFTITFSKDLAPGEYSLPVHVTYQPCNDTECRAPKTVDESLALVVGTEGDPLHADIFGAVEQKNETPPPASSSTSGMEENDLTRLINKYGFWGYILALGLAFVTGLLLSFSPCTYPMIPITVSIFAGQQRSLGRGFFLSLVYVGSMAVVYGIVISMFYYRTLGFKKLYGVFIESGILSGAVMFVTATAHVLGYTFAYESLADEVLKPITHAALGPTMFLVVVSIVLIIAGTFLDGIAMMYIIVPLFLPAIQVLGIDPIHFAMVVIICWGIGQQTPPVGAALFITSVIARVDVLTLTRANIPFIFVMFIVLALVILFPEIIVLSVPRALGL